jgi:predicted O-linked N-acetylglucosamine transferase (SPINDLY family)
VLVELGRLDEAETELRKALNAAPRDAQLHHNLAVLFSRCGSATAALEHYDRALSLNPAHPGARLNRGCLRLALRDGSAALEDFTRLARDATFEAEARAGRVRALLLLHRDEEALEEAVELLQRQPQDPLALRLEGIALASLGRLNDAQAPLAAAREPASAKSLYIERALERQAVCDWRDRERLLATIREALAEPGAGELSSPGVLFHCLGLPLERHELKAIAVRVAERVRKEARSLRTDDPPAPLSASRLRVGFISPNLREHAEMRLLRPLFAERDRERFEYYLYALNADDGSAIRDALAGSADVFVDMSSWSSGAIVQRIRHDRLHILVDPAGYFEGSRPEILAARAAPLQASLFATACTLGPGLLDYRLSDALVTPPSHQVDWYESLALLPAPHWTYDATQTLGTAGSREAHGLPGRGFVYCCFHQAFKICPDIFNLWMRLLRQTPNSVLWLLDGGSLVRANLTREAEKAGVDTARLVFAPRLDLKAHLGRQRHADLFLDTLHCGAHTTAADALQAGLPVLTRKGSTMASRICAALVHGAGMAECVADGIEAYEQKALELANAPRLLAEMKARLARARATASFFATAERVRAVERAFVAMIERHRAGLPPDTLIID